MARHETPDWWEGARVEMEEEDYQLFWEVYFILKDIMNYSTRDAIDSSLQYVNEFREDTPITDGEGV